MIADNEENGEGASTLALIDESYMKVLYTCLLYTSLPGPPNELHPLFEQQVKPYLQKLSPEIFYSRTVKLCGIGESKAAAMIQDMIDAQTNPTIAPYAKTGEVHLRVTARAKDEQEGKKPVSYTHCRSIVFSRTGKMKSCAFMKRMGIPSDKPRWKSIGRAKTADGRAVGQSAIASVGCARKGSKMCIRDRFGMDLWVYSRTLFWQKVLSL